MSLVVAARRFDDAKSAKDDARAMLPCNSAPSFGVHCVTGAVTEAIKTRLLIIIQDMLRMLGGWRSDE